MKRTRLLLLFLVPFLLAPTVFGQTARVQIVHNSPYAEAALVDIYVNSVLTLDDVAFRDATPFLDLPAETPLTIDVTGADAADNSAPVFTLADATLPMDATLLIVAAGDPLARAGNPAFDLFIADSREAAVMAGDVDAIAFHGSPDAPTVDVVERTAGLLVDDISFGEFSDYVSVPPAAYELDIQTADNSATAASFGADLSMAGDSALAILASGFLAPATDDDPGFGLLAVFADGTTALLPAIVPETEPATARVQVVHNSPYAEAALVDVYVNGALALDDVAFRDASPFLDLPADSALTIDITGADAADNSSPVFTLADAVLPADATLLIIAAGDPLARDGNPAFDLFIADAREAAATAGNAEAIVFHGSPDAPTVDVVERSAGTLVDDISFGEFSEYLSVPPAVYELDIQTADNSATAASFTADLSGAADAAIAVLASGFLAPATDDDPGFGLLAVFADGTTALLPVLEPTASGMARVQVVHNSPYAEAALVDVYVNGALALDDVAFRDASPFLDLPADSALTIDITGADAADNSSPVFTLADAMLPADATLIIIAAGDPLARDGNPAFDLFIGEAREAAATAGNAEFLVFHGSPDAPTVDVVARGAGTLVDDISFGEFASDYLSVPPARYEVDIETADNSATAASFAADLSGAADAALAVLASGFLAPASDADPGFGLLAVFADGTTALLPAIEETINFSLIDASTDMAIAAFDPMPQGAVLDFSALPATVNIRANLADEAESVVFALNGEEFNVESFAPYSLCGDVEGDYVDCVLPLGDHTVTAISYSEDSGEGSEIAMGAITFSVTNNGNSVSGFTLVDADTDEDIMELTEGMVLDLAALPANLNVRAEAGGGAKSVSFELSPTPYSRDEKVVPFALFGDIDGDYFGNSFAEGMNTITATPFSAVEGGDEGEALTVNFEVTGSNPGAAPLMTGHSEEAAKPQDTIALQDEESGVPETFELQGNYPNPFNPTTTISFSVPEASQVRLTVYDMLGRQVRVLVDGSVSAGQTEVVFDAAGLPTGTYLYRLTTPQGSMVNKMLLVK